MRPRWLKVISDLIGNPSKSLLVILSIAVGLFALGIILTIDIVVSEDMRIGYKEINPPNIQMQVTGVNDDIIQRIGKMESVGNIEGVHQFGLRILDVDGEWTSIDITARKSFENVEISKIKLIDGTLKLSSGEILIDQYKLNKIEIFPGNKLKLELPSGFIREMKLKGIIQDQTIGATRTGGGFFTAPPQGYLLWDDLPTLEQEETYNRLLITIEPDLSNQKMLRLTADEISNVIKKNDGTVINTFVRASEFSSECNLWQCDHSRIIRIRIFDCFSKYISNNKYINCINEPANAAGWHHEECWCHTSANCVNLYGVNFYLRSAGISDSSAFIHRSWVSDGCFSCK